MCALLPVTVPLGMSLDENRGSRELSPSMDAKAIFHQLTRMWTTHGVGSSQSRDARAFLGTVRESLAHLGQMNGLGVIRTSGGANAVAGCWPTPEEHIPSGSDRVRVGLFTPTIYFLSG